MNFQDSLTKALNTLLTLNPLFANIIFYTQMSFTHSMPTAGVYIKGKRMIMGINPNFFLSLNEKERVGLLMHEVLHLIFKHCVLWAKLQHRIANIAMDVSINQMIPEGYLPPMALLPSNFLEDINKRRKKEGLKPIVANPDENFMYYYNLLIENASEEEINAMQHKVIMTPDQAKAEAQALEDEIANLKMELTEEVQELEELYQELQRVNKEHDSNIQLAKTEILQRDLSNRIELQIEALNDKLFSIEDLIEGVK